MTVIQLPISPRKHQDTEIEFVPLSYRMRNGGMELDDGTLIVDCGNGIGISQPIGDGTDQQFFIDIRGLSALIFALRTLQKCSESPDA